MHALRNCQQGKRTNKTFCLWHLEIVSISISSHSRFCVCVWICGFCSGRNETNTCGFMWSALCTIWWRRLSLFYELFLFTRSFFQCPVATCFIPKVYIIRNYFCLRSTFPFQLLLGFFGEMLSGMWLLSSSSSTRKRRTIVRKF